MICDGCIRRPRKNSSEEVSWVLRDMHSEEEAIQRKRLLTVQEEM
jgi:hypothetical protein